MRAGFECTANIDLLLQIAEILLKTLHLDVDHRPRVFTTKVVTKVSRMFPLIGKFVNVSEETSSAPLKLRKHFSLLLWTEASRSNFHWRPQTHLPKLSFSFAAQRALPNPEFSEWIFTQKPLLIAINCHQNVSSVLCSALSIYSSRRSSSWNPISSRGQLFCRLTRHMFHNSAISSRRSLIGFGRLSITSQAIVPKPRQFPIDYTRFSVLHWNCVGLYIIFEMQVPIWCDPRP